MRRHVTDGETVSVEPSAGGSVFSGTEEIPECAFTLPPRWSMRYWKCRLCRGPSSAIRCPVRPATDPSCVSLHILEMDEKIGTVVPRDAVTPEERFFLHPSTLPTVISSHLLPAFSPLPYQSYFKFNLHLTLKKKFAWASSASCSVCVVLNFLETRNEEMLNNLLYSSAFKSSVMLFSPSEKCFHLLLIHVKEHTELFLLCTTAVSQTSCVFQLM